MTADCSEDTATNFSIDELSKCPPEKCGSTFFWLLQYAQILIYDFCDKCIKKLFQDSTWVMWFENFPFFLPVRYYKWRKNSRDNFFLMSAFVFLGLQILWVTAYLFYCDFAKDHWPKLVWQTIRDWISFYPTIFSLSTAVLLFLAVICLSWKKFAPLCLWFLTIWNELLFIANQKA